MSVVVTSTRGQIVPSSVRDFDGRTLRVEFAHGVSVGGGGVVCAPAPSLDLTQRFLSDLKLFWGSSWTVKRNKDQTVYLLVNYSHTH